MPWVLRYQECSAPLLCECLHRSRIRNDYFDYRGFGESDGERGRLVPAMQTEDIISVINWAEKQECIDNQRIGLWEHRWEGHVFSAAAQDQRVKCIVSQLAFADGDVLVTGEMNESERASFLSTLNKMAEKKKNTGKEMFVGLPGY